MNLTSFAVPFIAFTLAGCATDPNGVEYKTSNPDNANSPVQPETTPPVGGMHDGTSSAGVNPNNSVGR